MTNALYIPTDVSFEPSQSFRGLLVNREDRFTAYTGSSTAYSKMMLLSCLLVICISLIFVDSAQPQGAIEFCEPPDWLLCANARCLSIFFVCDGDDDCGDNSDEQNCKDAPSSPTNSECADNQFKCTNNRCIPLDDFCDREYDCTDRSDEYIGCTSDKKCNEFRCRNGYCVKNAWVCDGANDCYDFSDETDCGNRTITSGECTNEIDRFLCDNGRCIALNTTCDGKDDCGDNSDEIVAGCIMAEASCKKGIGCSHSCNKTPRGPACSCPLGYKLLNNQSCADINECIGSTKVCDQRCVNVAGSYYCICEVGYELQDDKKTCKVDGGEAFMIFSSKKEIRGFYLESKVYFPIAKNLQHVIGVSLDANYIYWSDIKKGDESIIRSLNDGRNAEVIVSAGLGLPEEIAVDWITGNVYFTDSLWKHIGVCKNDGSYCTVIINEAVDMPRGLALHPMNGEMYWSDFGIKPRISIAGMDGKSSRALVTENLVWPNGLAIDYPNRRLYWVDAKQRTIESVKLDGTDRREVLHTTATHPYSIAIFENKLYWSDWETKSIQSADKLTGKNRTTIVREMDTIYGIHIYHSVLKPKMPNPCNTQPCSQLCLLAVNRTYTCGCTPDKELANDKHSCKTIKKQEHLVVAAGKLLIDYYQTILGRPKITKSYTFHRITHVAYDSVTGTILADDQLSNSIFRYNPGNDEIRPIMNISNEYIGGMDFDYYGNNLYWSDVLHRSIEIHSMDTRERTVINFMEEPRDVLVIPEYGIMYVVFKSKEQYHIDKLFMTGAGTREHVVNSLHGPKVSMAFDRDQQRVIWADEGTGSIESISVRGDNRRLFRSGLREPVSLAVLGRDIFWTLKNSTRLQWADKQGRNPGNKGVTLGVSDYVESMVLVATRGIYTDTQHKCRLKNGGCSHVCLVAVMQHHSCACPPGMILNSDKRTCSLQTICTKDEIRCSDNNRCINKMRRCNGIKDCPNGEDEDECGSIKTCGVGEFTCRDGQCIGIESRCNSYFDCGDQSDEVNCDKDSCVRDEFQCLDGQCITKFLVCDGRNDCADFSDEINCGRHICDDSSFRCASGTCIPKSWECDTQNDCGDGSDENGEKCKVSHCIPDMFECANKRCLGPSLVCDNVDDCGDNSDEENCDKSVVAAGERCTTNEYKCHETDKCISLKLRCNGEQDCPKNDDEHNCARCESTEFPCENTKCIPRSWLCDHVDDCGDKSDEKHCDFRSAVNFTTIDKSTDCKQFRCATGTCLPYDKVCDGKEDCIDGTDEGDKCSNSCEIINPCQQICQKTPTGPLCLCREGFTPDNDGKSCTDIDECRQGVCSQICYNEPGTYSCSCFDGYVLRSNKMSCKVSGEPMEIITATKADIRKISASLSSIEVIHRQPNVDVTGLDVNVRRETLYWSNELLGTINRLNLKTEEFKLLSGLGRPGVLAIDWATDNVYFHDGEKPSSIKVCSLEEQKCAIVVKIEGSAKLMSIAIDPRNGWLFWSQTSFVIFEDPTSEIWRTDLSGSNQVNIAHERLGVVKGITIDYARSHLYWADARLQVVERSDLDGGNREILLRQIYQPLGINIFEDSIYLLVGTSGILKKCDLNGDKVCESIKVKSSNVNELFVLSQESRQPVVINVCQNHECNYMCVIRSDKFACICPNGYLTSANSTCSMNAADTTALKFTSTMLGLKKGNVRQEGGFFTGIIVSVALGIAVLSAYYYYQKKKLDFRNKNNLSIHFQNPSFDRSSTSGLTSDLIVPVLPPGEHEYTNPMSQVVMSKINMPKSSGRRTLELVSSDHSETELDEGASAQNTRLIS